jgi:serine/threonine protein kinase
MLLSAGLMKLQNVNVVRFCGYSIRPTALLFGYCEVDVNGTKVNNLSQLLSLYNDNAYFVFKERLDYICQATKGLIYLHSQGIIHRDFKPSNLLVNGDLKNIVVKLGDFDGIFVMKDTISATITSYGMKGMTLSYVAPEICSGMEFKATKKSDIFSWAMSVYEIISSESCPWENVLSNKSDTILTEVLLKGIRPSIKDVKTLYNEDMSCLLSYIEHGWDGVPENRTDLTKVYIYILFPLIILSIYCYVCIVGWSF